MTLQLPGVRRRTFRRNQISAEKTACTKNSLLIRRLRVKLGSQFAKLKVELGSVEE